MRQSMESALGEVPRLDVVVLDPASDVEAEKAPLRTPAAGASGGASRLALVAVQPDAVSRAPGSTAYGSYDLYVRGKIDDRLIDEIRAGLREAIVDARVQASGLDRREIEALTHVARTPSRTVTAEGERETNEVLNMLLPAGFMVLLLVSVLTSGQYLLTTTVEEKSNRVVEVLLSAVSARELMVGKILGQMAVGLLVLALYAGLGVVALISFAMLGLLDPALIAFLVVFFLLAYFTIASFMAAIGAAVNEMREAQTMMTPVMLMVMIPWILWLPLSRDPNSLVATVLSFVPPLGNFVMLLRMSSSTPPPMWQTWLAIVVSGLGAWAAVWFAAKVFRIGLLMFGKPPNFATLVRWARMA
jgi:ABC-type Na+ efflux pump permease subunit